MRRGFGFVGVLVTLVLMVIVGAVAYNIGWSDGVNTHLPAGTTAPAPYMYGSVLHPLFAGFGILWFLFILFGIFWLFRLAFWGFAGRRMWGYYGHGPGGFGFGIFGIFWFLLILFGIFWLFRLAFWGFAGRRMMMGGGGWGYGRGWGYGPGKGGRFEEMAQEWHKRQHGEQSPASGSSSPPPPPPDTRSV